MGGYCGTGESAAGPKSEPGDRPVPRSKAAKPEEVSQLDSESDFNSVYSSQARDHRAGSNSSGSSGGRSIVTDTSIGGDRLGETDEEPDMTITEDPRITLAPQTGVDGELADPLDEPAEPEPPMDEDDGHSEDELEAQLQAELEAEAQAEQEEEQPQTMPSEVHDSVEEEEDEQPPMEEDEPQSEEEAEEVAAQADPQYEDAPEVHSEPEEEQAYQAPEQHSPEVEEEEEEQPASEDEGTAVEEAPSQADYEEAEEQPADPPSEAEKTEDDILQEFADACAAQNTSLMTELSDGYPDLNLESQSFKDPSGSEVMTPLMFALERGKPETLKWILTTKRKSDGMKRTKLCRVDFQRPSDGRSCLHLLTLKNKVKLVRLLVDKLGATVTVSDWEGDMPLDLAYAAGYSDIVAILEARLKAQSEAAAAEVGAVTTTAGVTIMTAGLEDSSAGKGDETAVEVTTDGDSAVKMEAEAGSVEDEGDEEEAEEDADEEEEEQKQEETEDIATRTVGKMSVVRQKLVRFSGWLEKKSPNPPYSYQKRFVIVASGFMLWNDQEKDLINPKDKKEREKWKGHLNLLYLKEVTEYQSKSGNKFEILCSSQKDRGKDRKYLWKTQNEAERDRWCKSLRDHKMALLELMAVLD